jgi:cellulose synthase/poly-beta-1,6-N-acetylglucosamine synthase-like glycosyltransferase
MKAEQKFTRRQAAELGTVLSRTPPEVKFYPQRSVTVALPLRDFNKRGWFAPVPPVWRGLDAPLRRRVFALIPAYNEQTSIADTVRCLRAQDVRPDRIITIPNNCTDSTEIQSGRSGAEVCVIPRVDTLKAGALNQVLALIMPDMAPTDLVLVMDADTVITPNFIAKSVAAFDEDTRLGGVSGAYEAKPGGGWPGFCQRNEYARWGFDVRQQSGKAICLSGAASVYTVAALRKVVAARASGKLHGPPAVYDTSNFTEDFELTQAIKHAGSTVRNLMGVSIATEPKPTWSALHTQRRRWNRGITETLLSYGWTRFTWAMWLRWILYTVNLAAVLMSLFLLSYRITSGEGFHLDAWMAVWIGATAVLMLHKSITVAGSRGIWPALAALILIIEMPYDLFLHITFIRSLWDVAAGTSKKWRDAV